MPVVTKKYLVCDRCGCSIEVDKAFAGSSLEEMPAGWHKICGDRFLCPVCHPDYDLMMARHKVEVEDFFSHNG